jgi:hypothetical protein
VVVLKIDGKKVTRINEVEVRGLPEGVVFSADGKYLYVGNFIDGDVSILVEAQMLPTRVKLEAAGASCFDAARTLKASFMCHSDQGPEKNISSAFCYNCG